MWDEAAKTVRIPCLPDETWCGYSNIVHGGLIASVLDEAMAWVIKEVSGDWAFTADYQIRYKRTLEPGKEYVAVAEVEELGSRKITVNAVSPGFISTDMTAALDDRFKEKALESIPLGRLGNPQDIADAVAFFVSGKADYITGQELDVNGGLYFS